MEVCVVWELQFTKYNAIIFFFVNFYTYIIWFASKVLR